MKTIATSLFFFALGAEAVLNKPRKLMTKMNMTKVKAGQKAPELIVTSMKKKEKGTAGPPLKFSSENVEDLCTLWEVFDNMGRAENNNREIPGFEWNLLCDDFVPLQNWLCPSEDIVEEGICSHRRPWLNPAIREHYCSPLVDLMPEGPRRESCETWCTNYVSQDRGDCCNIDCVNP